MDTRKSIILVILFLLLLHQNVSTFFHIGPRTSSIVRDDYTSGSIKHTDLFQPVLTENLQHSLLSPSIPFTNYQGSGENLTLEEFSVKSVQSADLTTGDIITADLGQPWKNYWIRCTIDDIYNFVETNTMNHHFSGSEESWISETGYVGGNGYSVVDCYYDTISGEPPGCISIHLSTVPLGTTTMTEEWGSWSKQSSSLQNYPIVSATLQFWWAYAFDASVALPVINPVMKVKVNEATVFNQNLNTIIEEPIEQVSGIVECDITNLVSPNGFVKVELFAQAQTFASNYDSDMWAALDNVIVDVTYQVNREPDIILLNSHQFATNGEVVFETAGQTSWILVLSILTHIILMQSGL